GLVGCRLRVLVVRRGWLLRVGCRGRVVRGVGRRLERLRLRFAWGCSRGSLVVFFRVLDCCVYVSGPVHDVCSWCPGVDDAGGAVLAPYAVVYGVVVFE